MKSFFLIAGTVVYTLLGVMTFQTYQDRFECRQKMLSSVFAGVFWPFPFIAAGVAVLILNKQNVWECQSK